MRVVGGSTIVLFRVLLTVGVATGCGVRLGRAAAAQEQQGEPLAWHQVSAQDGLPQNASAPFLLCDIRTNRSQRVDSHSPPPALKRLAFSDAFLFHKDRYGQRPRRRSGAVGGDLAQGAAQFAGQKPGDQPLAGLPLAETHSGPRLPLDLVQATGPGPDCIQNLTLRDLFAATDQDFRH